MPTYANNTNKELVLGDERLDVIIPLLQNKRVGLIANQTSIQEHLGSTHILDALVSNNINVVRVFAPEHGFRGTVDAGQTVKDSKDIKTGIPITSLYGKNKRPSKELLNNIDVLIFDIQDVGARFYTYISTMHYAMEACAENNILFVVLDRPNPNDFIDGPIRKKEYKSFVSLDPIPILHGLTIGELALMINGEKWLSSSPDSCSLKVIEMKNWKHGDPYWLPIKPSPNLPDDQSVRLYPSLCFFEATNISIGRGTYHPFQVIGFPDKKYGNFTFVPTALPGFEMSPKHKDKICYGVDLREYPFKGGLSLKFFLDFYNKSEEKKAFFFSRPQWFDLLAGTKELRLQIIKELSEKEIKSSWNSELESYKKLRKKYILYKDNRY